MVLNLIARLGAPHRRIPLRVMSLASTTQLRGRPDFSRVAQLITACSLSGGEDFVVRDERLPLQQVIVIFRIIPRALEV